jgi:hypothetical protein
MGRRIIIPLALICLIALGACGSSKSSSNGVEKKSAAQIAKTALLTAKGAKSVHFSGFVVEGGDRHTFDMQLATGKRASGRMGIKGASLRIIRVGSNVYMNGTVAAWKMVGGKEGAAMASILAGKWFQVPLTGKDFASVAGFTDISLLFSQMLSEAQKSAGKLQKGSSTTVSGQEAITLIDTSDGSRYFVATTGEPYVLRAKGPKGPYDFRFDRWDENVSIKAPANAIDLSTFK